MLHKMIQIGIFVGCCAAVPILYQKNPEGFERLMRLAVDSPGDSGAGQREVTVARVEPSHETEVLTGRKVRIPAGPDGHFRGTFKLNGRDREAMIDTGATLVAINESTARGIGLGLTPADFSYTVSTANGEAHAAAVTIDELQIGRIYVRDVRAVVLEDDALKGTLIGMTFLNRLSRFEVKNGGLVLEQ